MEKRPGLYSKEVVALVVEDVLPKVVAWLRELDENDPSFTDPEEMAHLKEQVTKAVERGYYDGFDTAKSLSDSGWECDSELVDIFEETSWKAYRHHDAVVEQWVTRNEVKPELGVGGKVSFRDGNKEREGEVVEVRANLAQYTVFCEAMGHTHKDAPTPKSGMRRSGVILPFEEVKAL